MAEHLPIRLAIAALLALLSACQAGESASPGDWNFTGANTANLATMIDNPMDLVRGRASERGSGQLAAAAVSRLKRDQVKPLPSETTSQLPGGGSSGQGAGAGAAEVP